MDEEKRFWEIDLLRGIAVIMMVAYHLFYDLNYFRIYPINIDSGFWWFFARSIAITFILLAGVSLNLYSRAEIQGSASFPRYLKRGLGIFSWGIGITVITWIFLKDAFIRFGVLHLIGGACICLGFHLKNITFNSEWLVWLGLRGSFCTVDYFPLFPWFGVILIGISLGNIFYPECSRRFKLPDLDIFPVRFFSFLGRRSLLIYLIHQPILILLLYLLGAVKIGMIL